MLEPGPGGYFGPRGAAREKIPHKSERASLGPAPPPLIEARASRGEATNSCHTAGFPGNPPPQLSKQIGGFNGNPFVSTVWPEIH